MWSYHTPMRSISADHDRFAYFGDLLCASDIEKNLTWPFVLTAAGEPA
jgi:hypothetical protein